jgi:ELWxxDGT repeat protein
MSHARKLTLVALAALITTGTIAISAAAPAAAHDAGGPVLIDDINATGAGASFHDLHAVGEDLYFVADTAEAGRELYFHDASAGSTTLIDVNPGPAPSYPSSLATGPDGYLYFTADDGAHGRELWRANGATAELVKDIKPGPDSGSPQFLVAFDGQVYFAADDGTFSDTAPSGNELWRTDGTEGGTAMAPIDQQVTYLWELMVFDGAGEDRLFFSGYGVTTGTGTELWRYTASTDTVVEYDLRAGAIGSSPGFFTQAGTRLFLSADSDLYRIDNPEAAPAWTALPTVAQPGPIVAFGSTVWLRGRSVIDPTKFVLWSAVGAGAPSETPTAVDPSGIAMYVSTPLYAATSANGYEFWAGTAEYSDIVPGPDSGWPSGITPVTTNNRAVMWANADGLRRLGWIASGGGMQPFNPYPELDPLPVGQSPLALEADPAAGGWWHVGNDTEHGVSIWHMAANGATTTRIPSTDLAAGSADSEPGDFVAFGGDVLFVATDGTTTFQPWRFDPAADALTRLSGVSPADDANYPHDLTVSGNQVFFRSSRAAGGPDGLWVTDGTAGGTRRVSDTGGDPTFTSGYWQVPFKNGVLFDAETIDASPSSDWEPWFSDGTPAGTYRLADIDAGPSGSFPEDFAAVGEHGIFSANDDLWVTDGTPAGTMLLSDTNANFLGSVVIQTTGGPVAYFMSQTDGVWRTDGTPAGTVNVALHDDPMVIPELHEITSAGPWVYVSGSETWAIDSTTDAASQVTTPAGFTVWFDEAAALGAKAVFAGYVDDGGEIDEAVYALDGVVLTELPAWPGNFYYEDVPMSFTTHHEYVYFTADSDATGREIWRTDGTPGGTSMLAELSPGPGSVEPTALAAIGDRLYFAADVPGIGIEPHYIQLTPPPEAVIVPVEPGRYWDTRAGEETFDHAHEATGRLAARTPYRLDIAGRGLVPGGAQAVAANVAVILPDGAGWATLYPCTPEVPKASHLNYVAGNVLANNALVPLDGQGDVCLYSTQAADFIVDVNGYVAPTAPQVGIEPARYLDTRPGDDHNTFDGLMHGSAPIAAEQVVKVPIRGRGAVPADATAVIVNVTAVLPANHGYLTLWECSDPRPTTSTVNYTPADIVPNGAVINLSGDGELCIFTKAQTDIVLDVTGYLTADMETVHTLQPARLHDTRTGFPIIDGTATGPRLTAEQTIEIQVAGRGGVPTNATAAFLNVAAIETGGPGYLVLWPCLTPDSTTRPLASNVNYTPGMTRANNALTKLSPNGTICAYTKADSDLIIDVTGWID